MKYSRRKDATDEAKRRTKFGWPHRVVEVRRHDPYCLVSDGLIIAQHPCTCQSAQRVGWSLQMRK